MATTKWCFIENNPEMFKESTLSTSSNENIIYICLHSDGYFIEEYNSNKELVRQFDQLSLRSLVKILVHSNLSLKPEDLAKLDK